MTRVTRLSVLTGAVKSGLILEKIYVGTNETGRYKRMSEERGPIVPTENLPITQKVKARQRSYSFEKKFTKPFPCL